MEKAWLTAVFLIAGIAIAGMVVSWAYGLMSKAVGGTADFAVMIQECYDDMALVKLRNIGTRTITKVDFVISNGTTVARR